MKTNSVALIALLLSAILFSCSQEKIIELPLTMQNGYAPFPIWTGGLSHYPEYENNPWKNTYLKVSKLPEGLTDLKHGDIETNIYQSVYQEYLSGNITKDRYEALQKSWNWTPDTLSLSKTPVKTKIAFAYGKDSDGILKIVVDVNNNLDLTDDKLFTPFEMPSVDNNANKDSLRLEHIFNVSFETFVHDKIVPVSVPFYIEYSRRSNMFFCNFAQYATAQFKGEQIAVVSSGFINLSYENIDVAFMHNDLKSGEKIKAEDRYKKNEYIEIKNEIYRISGVNTNKSTLVLEKMGLSKAQLFSTQIGYKSYPFQGEEFTTKSTFSPESLKGKYVLLDFWAIWCGPCIEELPHLKELYAKTDRAKFEIVGIVGDSQPNTLTDAIDRHAITWPQILSDDTNKIKETYGINGYPATFLIDTEGIIIAKNLRGNELEEKILSLIKE
jgi:thiol-disulfide isomerase/thioredoxin